MTTKPWPGPTGHTVNASINHLWECEQEKHQIWYKQGDSGPVITDRISLHYTRLRLPRAALKAAIPLLTVLGVCVAVHPLGPEIIPLVSGDLCLCVSVVFLGPLWKVICVVSAALCACKSDKNGTQTLLEAKSRDTETNKGGNMSMCPLGDGPLETPNSHFSCLENETWLKPKMVIKN